MAVPTQKYIIMSAVGAVQLRGSAGGSGQLWALLLGGLRPLRPTAAPRAAQHVHGVGAQGWVLGMLLRGYGGGCSR